MRPTTAWLAILGSSLCLSSADWSDVVEATAPPAVPLEASSFAYRAGPLDLRLGDRGALLIPADCRARCAGAAFAQVECEGTLLEARSPAILLPEPEHEERLPGGAVVQLAQYGDAFMGVLVSPNGHFAVLQQPGSHAGRKWIVSLLHGFHTPLNERAELNCPDYIVLG